MTDLERGTDRLGRRAKRFLTPLQKYEIWLQLVRGETTVGEAADRYGVDRSTIMRLRMVAKEGPWQRCQSPSPACRPPGGTWSWRRPGWARRSRSWPSGCYWWREKGVGAEWPGPPRVDAATKSGLLDLLEQACKQGWTVRAACQVLELGELRTYRCWAGGSPASWRTRRPVAARCTACWTGRSPRSCGCSRSGARSTAPTASSLTAVPTWSGSGSRRPACAACWSARAYGCGRCRGQAAASARRSRTGWSTPQLHLDLRHDPLHQGGRGRDRDRGPGQPQVAGRDRLG